MSGLGAAAGARFAAPWPLWANAKGPNGAASPSTNPFGPESFAVGDHRSPRPPYADASTAGNSLREVMPSLG